MSNSQGLNEAQSPNVPQPLAWVSLRTRLQHAVTSLRTLFLVAGYTVPMLILFTPGNIPVRFLEPIGLNEQNRWVADLIILVACPALVWLAQVHDGPAIRSLVGATIRRSSSHEPFVAFTVEELSAVTSDFVGRGGFGVVYATAHRTAQPEASAPTRLTLASLWARYGTRGRLESLPREGRCAIKWLHSSTPAACRTLRDEIRLLSKCRHENLLPLLGYCLDTRALSLVYPLMTGGNLDDRLHRSAEARERIALLRPAAAAGSAATDLPALTWRERLRVVRDATRALVYLHTPTPTKGVVLHRDVKGANILLDGLLNAKLADVELATESHELSSGRTHVSSSSMIGTAGYVDPLYANTGQYSQHTDGYAMGVTLLTCLVGRPALEAMDRAESMLEEPTLLARQPPGQSCLDATAGWPQATSVALAQLVVGLSWRRSARSRMPLSEALATLEELADTSNTRPGIAAAAGGACEEGRECVVYTKFCVLLDLAQELG